MDPAAPLVTAEQFQELLEEGDRWLELVAGRVVRLQPPDEVHGNVVRNLSKALGKSQRSTRDLFACFELGLIVARGPDTVRCPAISCFTVADGMGEADKLVSDRRPQLIVEVASSNERREAMSERIRRYQEWGVPLIWVFDPQSRHVHVFRRGELPRMLKENEFLDGGPLLPGFRLLVGDVFADPAWLDRRPPPREA